MKLRPASALLPPHRHKIRNMNGMNRCYGLEIRPCNRAYLQTKGTNVRCTSASTCQIWEDCQGVPHAVRGAECRVNLLSQLLQSPELNQGYVKESARVGDKILTIWAKYEWFIVVPARSTQVHQGGSSQNAKYQSPIGVKAFLH